METKPGHGRDRGLLWAGVFLLLLSALGFLFIGADALWRW